MKQQNERQTLQEAWLHAVDQAMEAESVKPELDENKLANVAGLQLKAHLRAGSKGFIVETVSNCCTVNLSCP